jgi:hypothetical protein
MLQDSHRGLSDPHLVISAIEKIGDNRPILQPTRRVLSLHNPTEQVGKALDMEDGMQTDLIIGD